MLTLVLRYIGFALPLTILIGGFLLVASASALDDRAPEIRMYANPSLASRLTVTDTQTVFMENFTGGVRVALGDLDGDGEPEHIAAAGPGGGPHIQAWSMSGERRASFFAYDETFREGLMVAAGDVDGDGRDEIITGAASLSGAEVKVFSSDGALRTHFYPYDDIFRGTVTVAAGDVDGDGRDEIITGAGPGGAPHVRVFSGDGEWRGLDYFPYPAEDRGGVAVAAADTTGDGREEIITSIMSRGPAAVKVYGYEPNRPIFATFTAFPESFRGGVQIAAADLDNDGRAEIITAAGPGGGPHLRIFDGGGARQAAWGFAYEEDFRGGVYVAAFFRGGTGMLITGPDSFTAAQHTGEKRILVDISEQRLWAYEGNTVVRTFLISSGLPGFETPRGTFAVSEKIPVKHYRGYYGPGSPHNFNLPNTKWNLRFHGPYLLHGAYWHNDFGKKKSHGCINIHYTNAEWIYGWAEIGTPVTVQD